MAKHSKHEREKRAQEHTRLTEISAAWAGSVPPETAKAFAATVKAVKERGPLPPQPDMAPGTAPRPPRPGREPKPPKEPSRSRSGR